MSSFVADPPPAVARPPVEATPAAWSPPAAVEGPRPALAGVGRRVWRHPLFLLSLITVFGAFLRLVSLDQPALWGDEAFTFSRVCGGYQQMLGILQTDGFMPLHYSLYWWIGQQWDLSPLGMRLPVAIAGAFMPPAMYFLARQLRLPAGTALATALFAATSAYMLTYSRDAKMYMPFWLFVATHVACLFWWLNADPRAGDARRGAPAATRYLCWLAAGVAMAGYHATGAAVLGVEALAVLWLRWGSLLRGVATAATLPHAVLSPLLRVGRLDVLSDRGRWHRPIRTLLQDRGRAIFLPFLLGVAVIGGAVKLHFEFFSRWDDRMSDDWGTSGIHWVQGYNAERDGADLLRFTATAFAFSWEWPNRTKVPGIDPRAMKLLIGASCAIAGLALLGALVPRRRAIDAAPAGVLPGLFVVVWLAVPAYVAYCRSIQPFMSPWAILADFGGALREAPWLGAALLVLAGVAAWQAGWTWRGRLRAAGGALLVAAAVFGALCVVYLVLQHRWDLARAAREAWRSVWMPRYLGFVWPAFAIALCVLLMRLPARPLRAAALGLLVAVNLAQFSARVWGGSEPPTDRLTADIAAAQPLFVRQQQLAADVVRQTVRLIHGRPTRLARLGEQVRKLPLTAPDTRIYVQTGAWSPEPGGGVIGSFAARYYLAWRVGLETNPREFRRFRGVVDRQWNFPIGLSPRPIAADVNPRPQYRRLITWDRWNPGQRDVNFDDPVLKALGPGWRRVDETLFTARDHWTWRHLYTMRRREYARVSPPPPPPPPPATTAATKPS